MSRNLVSYMNNLGVATSRCSVYNPQSNGRCEKYNDVIWSLVELGLKTRSLQISQIVLSEGLHSMRSLLCTSTNSKPHERFLKFQRRSAPGTSVTSWLNDGAEVFLIKGILVPVSSSHLLMR